MAQGQTVKAFISNPNSGPEWLDRDHVAGMHFDTPAEAYAGEWAVNEASRILAHTQKTDRESNINWPTLAMLNRVRDAKCYSLGKDIQAALAESLTRFCQMEGF